MSDMRRMQGKPPADAPKGLAGKHVLIMLLAFFGVVFAVNGIFLTRALSTYSGVVSKQPYVRGLHYNERIAAASRQTALGWHEVISVKMDGTVELTLIDSGSNPVTGLAFTGFIGRPSTNQLDRHLVLAEVKPGHYVGNVKPLHQGTWVVDLAGRREGVTEPVWRTKRREWLKQ
ncbi:MAG: FixH family protein [Hyphomicrobiaceae bacterium]